MPEFRRALNLSVHDEQPSRCTQFEISASSDTYLRLALVVVICLLVSAELLRILSSLAYSRGGLCCCARVLLACIRRLATVLLRLHLGRLIFISGGFGVRSFIFHLDILSWSSLVFLL